MVNNLPSLPTIGAIADRFGVPPERVEQEVRRLGIRPAARAGNARVFSLEAVERIRRGLSGDSGAGQ